MNGHYQVYVHYIQLLYVTLAQTHRGPGRLCRLLCLFYFLRTYVRSCLCLSKMIMLKFYNLSRQSQIHSGEITNAFGAQAQQQHQQAATPGAAL